MSTKNNTLMVAEQNFSEEEAGNKRAKTVSKAAARKAAQRRKMIRHLAHVSGKILSNIICAVSFAFILWILLSIVDVDMHNMNPGGSANMAWWNAFTFMLEHWN